MAHERVICRNCVGKFERKQIDFAQQISSFYPTEFNIIHRVNCNHSR